MSAIPTNKKIAIIHDSLTDFGGAERVLFHLLSIFPQADVYTSLIQKNLYLQVQQQTQGKIFYSFLSKLSLAIKYPSFFKPYFYHFYWESLNLDQYDLVISSSHSFCANFVKVKNKHLSYIYTPPRFLHEEFNELSWLKKPIIKDLVAPYFKYLRKKIAQKLKKIDLILVDSINVQKRLKKYYHIKAAVVYPPVPMAQHKIKKNKKITQKYLFFSRLVKQKGIELVIQAFNQNGKALLVVGTSNQEKKWQKMAQKNIQFLGFVEDQKLPNIYRQSKALIYAAIAEDFGMVPVEVMSHGISVIAFADGGSKETIVDQKTGLFFKKYDPVTLNQTIEKFEQMQFNATDCINQAKKFAPWIFEKSFLAQVNSLLLES